MCCGNNSIESFIKQFNEKRHEINLQSSNSVKQNIINQQKIFKPRKQILGLNGHVQHIRHIPIENKKIYLHYLTQTTNPILPRTKS